MAVGENITNVHFPLKKLCILPPKTPSPSELLQYRYCLQEGKKNLPGCKLQGSLLTQ